jgi:hypothetical protein
MKMKYIKLFEGFKSNPYEEIIRLSELYNLKPSSIPDHEMYYKMVKNAQIFLTIENGLLVLTLTTKINDILTSLISTNPEKVLKHIGYIMQNINNKFAFKTICDEYGLKDTGHRFDETYSNNFDYDFIIKCMVKKYNYGNTISDKMPDFEKSDEFKEVSDNDSYILQFNKYLMDLGLSDLDKSKQNLSVPEPISWYSKLT